MRFEERTPPPFSSAVKPHISTATVYLIHPPSSLPYAAPFIISATKTPTGTLQFNHPITGNPLKLPQDFNLNRFSADKLAVSCHVPGEYLVFPEPEWENPNLDELSFFALGIHGGLHEYPPDVGKWVRVLHDKDVSQFDDLIIFNHAYYAVTSSGILSKITRKKRETVAVLAPNSQLSWGRIRIVCDVNEIFMVLREMDTFRVYNKVAGIWKAIKRFDGDGILFMSRYSYFFRPAFKTSPGSKYNNCILFSKDAFGMYGTDDIGVFRLGDGKFGLVGQSVKFPKIDWSPPLWVLNASSMPHTECQDQGDGRIDCESNIQEKDNEVMHSNVFVEAGASLLNGTPRVNVTESVPIFCTFFSTKRCRSDSTTAKFEGYDVRCDLVPTLQKIWQKHGNILENSIIHNGDIVGRALESLASVVRILEDNTAQSLSSSQADYLNSALSDLRCMRFKVCWLTPFVENAIKLHQDKPLLDSLKNLERLSVQARNAEQALGGIF